MSPDVTRLGRGQLQTRLCAKPQAGDGKAADESPNGQVLDPSRGTLKRWENCRRKPKYDLKIIGKKMVQHVKLCCNSREDDFGDEI